MGNHALSGIDGFEGRADLFFVDPAKILVVGGWNDRTDFSGETELVESIKAVGVRVPLRAVKTKAGAIELIDGERRLRATLRARKEGAAIKSVPVILAKRGESEIDLYIDSIIANTGKALSPTEEANSFKRLKAWGISVKDIAAKTGRSETLVRSRLDLSGTSPAVKTALDAGEITVKDAEKIARESDGKVDAQAEALEKKKEEKKTPKIKPLSLYFKSGAVRYSGGGSFATCQPLADILINEEFKKSLVAAGYDPETIKVSISQRGAVA